MGVNNIRDYPGEIDTYLEVQCLEVLLDLSPRVFQLYVLDHEYPIHTEISLNLSSVIEINNLVNYVICYLSPFVICFRILYNSSYRTETQKI